MDSFECAENQCASGQLNSARAKLGGYASGIEKDVGFR